MACTRCEELNQMVTIERPSDLENVLRVIRGNLADGTLASIAPERSSMTAMQPIEHVAPAGPWPDLLHYVFACTACGQRFQLDAETYHGSGGSWRPV
jgi:hypothetical protein